jgi:hypothetical protein
MTNRHAHKDRKAFFFEKRSKKLFLVGRAMFPNNGADVDAGL